MGADDEIRVRIEFLGPTAIPFNVTETQSHIPTDIPSVVEPFDSLIALRKSVLTKCRIPVAQPESAGREGGSGIYSARQLHRVREASATPAAKRSS